MAVYSYKRYYIIEKSIFSVLFRKNDRPLLRVQICLVIGNGFCIIINVIQETHVPLFRRIGPQKVDVLCIVVLLQMYILFLFGTSCATLFEGKATNLLVQHFTAYCLIDQGSRHQTARTCIENILAKFLSFAVLR